MSSHRLGVIVLDTTVLVYAKGADEVTLFIYLCVDPCSVESPAQRPAF
jgi:hypothetical protein